MKHDYEYMRKFVIQQHIRSSKSRRNDHWDLRIEDTKRKTAWSWALPKEKMPEFGSPVAAYRAPDHKIKYMDFEGTLENDDKVKIYDSGKIALKLIRGERIYAEFFGRKVKGRYIMIKMEPRKGEAETWLIIKGKDQSND